MINRKQVKEISRQQLNRNGNWKIPILLALITFFVTGNYPRGLNINDSFIMTISLGLVISMLNIFFVNSCLKIAKSEKVETIRWSDTLISLNTFIKCVLYSILISLIEMSLTWIIIFIGSMYVITIPVLGATLLVLSLVIGGIISIYCTFSIFLILDRKIDVFKAIYISAKLIRGHFWEILLLGLSFILWYIISIITLGVAMLWVLPYITVTFANYYLILYKKQYDKNHDF